MSESSFYCSICSKGHFLNLLQAVMHVISETAKGKGSRHVPCCVQGCLETVRKFKLRLHIRKSHGELCTLSCSVCQAKFVEQRDLDNHLRNGCPRTVWKRRIGTFFENIDFSDSSTVDISIKNTIQLDKASRNAVSEVVDLLYKHLQHNLPSLSINKLVKGGSVGKGTAVKDKADIDFVVFLNDVKTMKDHKLKLQETKDCLESCLKESPYQITHVEQTQYAVKFRLTLSQEFDIDLLPTFTTNQSSEQLYNEMIGCTTEEKAYYSAGLVSFQVEFVKGQPSIVKDLIRLVKYWRKTCIEDTGKTRLPSSYPLELITIHCWEKAGKPQSFDIRAGFRAVLQQLVDYCHIDVCWYKYYNMALAERGIKGIRKSRPFVLDPANPTNNVCSASDAEGWKTVADVAKMTLEKHPSNYISFNRNWQI